MSKKDMEVIEIVDDTDLIEIAEEDKHMAQLSREALEARR
jgi:hypothetical protein